jgi:hypothetical protein
VFFVPSSKRDLGVMKMEIDVYESEDEARDVCGLKG